MGTHLYIHLGYVRSTCTNMINVYNLISMKSLHEIKIRARKKVCTK